MISYLKALSNAYVSLAAGPAGLLSLTNPIAGAYPLKNRAVGGQVETFVGRLVRGETTHNCTNPTAIIKKSDKKR